jgi:hypothetical protein
MLNMNARLVRFMPAAGPRRRLVALAAGLAIVLSPVVALAPAASAGTGVGCYLTTCDNLDPTTSYNSHTGVECDSPAKTLLSVPAFGGTLDLRWGASCIVNWTRFTPARGNTWYQVWTVRESDNYATTYEFYGSARVSYYDNEVYAPGPAGACVSEWTGSQWLPDVCVWQ